MTRDTKTATSMVVFMDLLKAGRLDGRRGLRCGRKLGSMKVLRWYGVAFLPKMADRKSAFLWSVVCSHLRTTFAFCRRAYQHVTNLLNLISQFPRVNPSNIELVSEGQTADIPKLFRQIRSKYKALCSTVNARPREFDPTSDQSY